MFAKKLSVVFCLCFFLFQSVFAAEWDRTKRQPVRARMLECVAMLVPPDTLPDDTVGVEISSSRIEDFRREMAKAVEERGLENLRGSHLFITGIENRDEHRVQALYEDTLVQLGFTPGDVRVRVLAVPRTLLAKQAELGFKDLFERLCYFFPSLRRDYQAPILAEMVSGLAADAAIEVTNVVYLYQSLPAIDAHLVVSTHAAVLTLYIVYKKFMVNWLLRPGTGRIESFLKQCLTSAPFVANYAIFGKFSQISAFFQTHGWNATLQRFPYELAHFASTQGTTIFLQTLFYALVITKGVRGWEYSKTGAEESRAARVLSNLITVPILSFDAILLAVAAANQHAVAHLGPIDLNTGHVGLAALTAVGSALWIWPKLLDPTIHWYQAIGSGIHRAREFFGRRSSGAADQPEGIAQPKL